MSDEFSELWTLFPTGRMTGSVRILTILVYASMHSCKLLTIANILPVPTLKKQPPPCSIDKHHLKTIPQTIANR